MLFETKYDRLGRRNDGRTCYKCVCEVLYADNYVDRNYAILKNTICPLSICRDSQSVKVSWS